MSPFAALLDLQAHDTATDQHRHRRANLPERGAIVSADRAIAAIDADIATISTERDRLARDQKRYEDEAAAVEEKAAAENARLYSGAVKAPKELQALQDEIDALHRRQSTLEDHVLELMEQVEPLDAQLAELNARRSVLVTDVEATRVRLAEAEAAIDAELAVLESERAAIVVDTPAAVLAEYEQLRKGLGGVAVAKLEAGSCRGCHLHLSALELDRIKKLPPDEIVHCEECGRILVR